MLNVSLLFKDFKFGTCVLKTIYKIWPIPQVKQNPLHDCARHSTGNFIS